jgi:hypothetical protein
VFKKTYIALFISCLSASSYAYQINSTLFIENKTDKALELKVGTVDRQIEIFSIAPHLSRKVDMSIGGWELYKYYPSAPFTISDAADHKLYVQGRVNYYVGPWPTKQYNSLDALSAATGLTLDPTYSCLPSDSSFENKIVITGTPQGELQAAPMSSELHCQGFRSSSIRDSHQYYTPVCSDGKTSAIFWKIVEQDNGYGLTNFVYSKGNHDNLCSPDSGKYCEGGTLPNTWLDDAHIKNMLDDIVRKGAFCGSW